MVWSGYEECAHYETTAHVSSDDDDVPNMEPLEFNDWITFYEPHLSNMWNELKTYMEVSRTREAIMPYCDFYDFCDFCYNNSKKISMYVP